MVSKCISLLNGQCEDFYTVSPLEIVLDITLKVSIIKVNNLTINAYDTSKQSFIASIFDFGKFTPICSGAFLFFLLKTYISFYFSVISQIPS